MIRQETIRLHSEGAPCDWCGADLNPGNACWIDLETGCIFCSLLCHLAERNAEAADHAIEATDREGSCEFCPAEGGGCCVCRGHAADCYCKACTGLAHPRDAHPKLRAS